MGLANWCAGGADPALARLQAPSWVHLVGHVAQPPRPITLALPCCGIDGAGHALAALGVPFEAKYVYDIRISLRGALARLHGQESARRFHLGPETGNILNVDVSTRERVDGIITGPPCPPWSSIGARRAQDDPREAVYQKVIDIIVDQGCKGALFFILEMVPGIQHRRRGASVSYYDSWISELHQRAPQWVIQSWRLNTCAFGVP